MTEILFRNWQPQGIFIKTVDIVAELKRLSVKKSRLVVKLDIEGAEFRILSSHKVLRILAELDCLVLVALHPGFQRIYRKDWFGGKMSSKIWQLTNQKISRQLFDSIKPNCNVYRTNHNPVNTSWQFSSLANAGDHEFILNFGKVEI